MSFNKKGFIPCSEQNEPPTLFVLRLSDKPFPYTGRLSKSCYTKAGDGITGRELFLNPETGEIALIFTKGMEILFLITS